MRRRYRRKAGRLGRRRPASSGDDLCAGPRCGVPRFSGLSDFQLINAAEGRGVTARSGEMQEAQVGELAIPLLEVEAVADVELVGHRETDIADGEVVDEPAVGTVEEGHGGNGVGA